MLESSGTASTATLDRHPMFPTEESARWPWQQPDEEDPGPIAESPVPARGQE